MVRGNVAPDLPPWAKPVAPVMGDTINRGRGRRPRQRRVDTGLAGARGLACVPGRPENRAMSFESRLRQETPRWVAEGIVTPEQAERIQARHPEHEGAAARKFLAIVTLLGGALCIVGVALIVSANWDKIHRWVKLATLVALMVAAYGGGFWLKVKRGDYPKLGDAAIMAGCAFFMLGIGLVSQIFHLDGRPGDAVLVWIAAIVAVPFLVRSAGAFFVLLVAVYTWLVIEATARDGWLRLEMGREWGGPESLPFVLLIGSLVLYWTAFLWRRDWRGFAGMQQAWPVAIVCATVYMAGFAHEHWWSHEEGLLGMPALVLAGLSLVAGAVAARQNWAEWRMLSPWLLLAGGPAAIALGNFFGDDVRVACAVLSWGTLLALNVFMARAGLAQGKPWLVNVAIAFVALNLFTRYFDIFSTMLDQGLMFLVSGAVVLGLGWFLERKRRTLLATMRHGEANGQNGGLA